MRRPHPRSTLFPYTTLFRSARPHAHGRENRRDRGVPRPERRGVARGLPTREPRALLRRGRLPGRKRSEEHTSELQSNSEIVCPPLLEKKKSFRTTSQRCSES